MIDVSTEELMEILREYQRLYRRIAELAVLERQVTDRSERAVFASETEQLLKDLNTLGDKTAAKLNFHHLPQGGKPQ